MPRMKPEDVELFLQEPHVGVLATLRRDGMPYTVPVWWLWKDGAVWLTGTYSRVWCKQLLRDGRSSLCIESGPPFTGHVEFDGRCVAYEPKDHDIWPISRELAEKYVGRRDPANDAAVESFFANMKTEPRLLFRMEPQVMRAIDMRLYRGKRADRDYQARQAGSEQ